MLYFVSIQLINSNTLHPVFTTQFIFVSVVRLYVLKGLKLYQNSQITKNFFLTPSN